MAPPDKPATRKQVLLYALLMLAGAGVCMHTGIATWREGHNAVLGQRSYSAPEIFFYGLVFLVVSAVLFAIDMGWMKGGPGAPR